MRVILVDDAMISMGFARSLAEGWGLVWYCGHPRVQGYTNLGWTLYMALWHKMGLSPEYKRTDFADGVRLADRVCVWALSVGEAVMG